MAVMKLLREQPILRLLAINLAIGAALGLGFVATLVSMDLHGIGRLIRGSEDPIAALALLTGGFVVTFASVVAGGAIMLLPSEHSGTGRGTPRQAAATPGKPVLVPVGRGPASLR
jgi:hypothetical protein